MAMKPLQSICGVGVLGGMILVPGWAIEPGDTLQEVKQELGEPTGSIEVGDSLVYMYDRGKIRLEGGTVVSADLISAEELASRRAAEALERERQAEALRERRARRYEEGTRVLADRLDDPEFMHAPAEQRLAYWRFFRIKYPEVSMPADYEVAVREREAELRTQRAEARIRDLEAQARVAEEEAKAAENRSHQTVTAEREYYGFPTVVYSTPSRCICGLPTRRACPVHHRSPRHKATYTPYHSTPGYGYQRPLTGSTGGSTIKSRPFNATGSRGPVPMTRGQVQGH